MTTPSFTQPQREALINLLTLAMYADSHLSLAEEEALNAFVESIGWESGRGRTVFLTDAIHRAQALTNETDTAAYLHAQAVTFDTAESQAAALAELTRFLKTDGIAEPEAPFLAGVHQLFSR